MKKNITTLILGGALLMSAYNPVFGGEKVAYLGIATGEINETLKTQLTLSNGVVVADVAADGPAAEKLEKHDILTKFNDQLLINPEQLTALMKTAKKGDVVDIEYVRFGEPDATKITLGERDAEEAKFGGANAFPGFVINGNNMKFNPGGADVQVLDMLNGNIPEEIQKQIEAIRKQAEQMQNKAIPGVNKNNTQISVSSNGSSMSSIVWAENDKTFVITTKDGEKSVKIAEKGETKFEGPINSDEDLEKVPEEFRAKVKEIQKNSNATSGVIIQQNGRFGEGKVGQ